MTPRPLQTALCALWWTVAGCSDSVQSAPQKQPEPRYTLERPTDALPAPTPRDDSFRRGVSLSTFASGSEDVVHAQYEKFLEQVTELGATDLELVVRWWQVDVGSVEIAPTSGTVDDELLMWLMDEANGRGLRVALTPVLEVESKGQTRGEIAPKSWDRWWWSYQRFVMHYARIAAGHHAKLLSAGSELVSTETQGERWRDLLSTVRKVYDGKIVYAANIDHLDSVSFWDAVDVVGVTGHQRELESASGTDEQLRQRLMPLARKLRDWSTTKDKSYFFTDLAAQGASAGTAGSQLDELRRSRTLYELWHDDPRLSGLFAGTAQGEAQATGASPRQQVLRYWYRASRADAQGAL